VVRLTDAATGQVTYRIAPDFEWNASTSRAQIRIQLAGQVIAVHDTAYDASPPPPNCSGSPSAAPGVDPEGFGLLFAPGLAALLAFALLQARRRRAEAGLTLAPGGAVSPPVSLHWRVAVAGATAGVFLLVISIPVPLLGPGRGTARAVSPASVTYYHGDHLGSSVVTEPVHLPIETCARPHRPFGGVVAEAAGGSSEPQRSATGQRFESGGDLNHGARS
jgi:hypothetical protein